MLNWHTSSKQIQINRDKALWRDITLGDLSTWKHSCPKDFYLHALKFIQDSDTISDRDKSIFISRYGDGNTYRQIGNDYDLSYVRIRAIVKEVLKKYWRSIRGKYWYGNS